MFNLLPSLFKDEIKSEYRIRKWIVLLSLVFVTAMVFLVLSYFLLIVSSNKEKQIKEQIIKKDEVFSSKSVGDILKIISSTNQKLAIFENVMDYPKILPTINIIISKKNNDISINDFNLVSKKGESLVLIRGVSRTRESLVSFVKNLGEVEEFASVDLPVSNLAKQKDIDFNINIKIIN